MHLQILFMFTASQMYTVLKLVFCEYEFKMTHRNKKDFSEEYKLIGLNIAYYRKMRGLSQIQLSERINISRTHLSNIEAPNVPTSISLEVLLQIASELDIPASLLLNFPLDSKEYDKRLTENKTDTTFQK